MGFFNLFKKQPTIQDEFFGKLTFIDFRDSSKDYFEGRGKFSPTNDEIEYLVDGDIIGPTKEQRDFYKKIEDSYDEIIAKISPLIEQEFRNWKEDFEIKDFRKEFTPIGLSIPRLTAEVIAWNISFNTIHDRNHQITVDLENFEPEGVLIDG